MADASLLQVVRHDIPTLAHCDAVRGEASTPSFKLSRDPQFAEKVIDVVGLYLNPPDNALVLSVDEKTQVQALDRTQPGLPMKPGRAGTLTHDYKRHGTTNLYAAFNVATGEVLGGLTRRHRATEFRQFLAQIDRATPVDLDLHLVVDNSSTHTTEAIRDFLAAHPRFHLHFTPTSASTPMSRLVRCFQRAASTVPPPSVNSAAAPPLARARLRGSRTARHSVAAGSGSCRRSRLMSRPARVRSAQVFSVAASRHRARPARCNAVTRSRSV